MVHCQRGLIPACEAANKAMSRQEGNRHETLAQEPLVAQDDSVLS